MWRIKSTSSSVRWQAAGDPKSCSAEGCSKSAIYKFYDKGFCSAHKSNGVAISANANNKRLSGHISRADESLEIFDRKMAKEKAHKSTGWINSLRKHA